MSGVVWTMGRLPWLLMVWIALNHYRGTEARTLDSDKGEMVAFVQIRDASDGSKREIAPFPDVLDIDLEFRGNTEKLVLEKQKNLDAERLKVSSSEGYKFKPTRSVAFYQDLNNMAAIMVESHTNSGRLVRTLTGTLFSGSKALEIRPASKSLQMLEDILAERGLEAHDSHMMHVLKEVNLDDFKSNNDQEGFVPVHRAEDISGHHSKKQVFPASSTAWGPTQFKRAVVRNQKNFHVEMMLLVDYTVYEFWLNELGSEAAAKEEIAYFYTHLFNAMYMAFRNLNPDEITIVLWLTEIHIIDSISDELCNAGVTVGSAVNASALFFNVNDYMARNGFDAMYTDNVQLWTKKDLKTPTNTTVPVLDSDLVGLAYICGLCRADRSVALNEDRGYFSWLTGAHELGHNLGSEHDNSSGCYNPNYYIMSPSQVVLNEEISKTALTFSDCSINHFKRCLTGEPRTTGFEYPRLCTYDTVCEHGKPLEGVDDLPGQKLDLDEQCRLFVDPDSTYNETRAKQCSGSSTYSPCHFLWCVDTQGNCKLVESDYRAAMGTPCADTDCTQNCVCYHADCVPISSITSPIDENTEQCKTTVYQIEGECTDYYSNCDELAKVNPWICFGGDLYLKCNRSCMLNNLFYLDGAPCSFSSSEVTSEPVTVVTTAAETTVAETTIATTVAETTVGATVAETTVAPTVAETTVAPTVAETTTRTLYTTAPLGECMPLHWACDYKEDCLHGADEDYDWCQTLTCPDNYVMCPSQEETGQVECINATYPCDGYSDCYNSNDESISYCESHGYPIQCYSPWEIPCPLNRSADVVECIHQSYPCDGMVDCAYSDDENITWCRSLGIEPGCFYSDEVPCPGNETLECIPLSYFCDQYIDCVDGADEDPTICANLECPPGTTPCPNMGEVFQCIEDSYFCDGFADCVEDGQDENVTLCLALGFTPMCYYEEDILCPGNAELMECIDAHWACDGENDCSQGTDEELQFCEDLVCPSTSTYCPRREFSMVCIEREEVCGSGVTCIDGGTEDAKLCATTVVPSGCKPGEVRCYNEDYCIPHSWMCDDIVDCLDGSDENTTWCQSHCQHGAFSCPRPETRNQCLRFDYVCDGYQDCEYGNDEDQSWCEQVTCSTGSINCPEGSMYGYLDCIPLNYGCDGYPDCAYGGDENATWCLSEGLEPSCYEGYTLCPSINGTVECFNASYACDGYIDCELGRGDEDYAWCQAQNIIPQCYHRDEMYCIFTDPSSQEEFVHCLPREWVCDNDETCLEGRKCEQLTCATGLRSCPNPDGIFQCIDQSYFCDGICDCMECSEESLSWCASQNIPLQCYYPEDIPCPANSNAVGSAYFHCIPPQWVCDGYPDCDGDLDEKTEWCESQACDHQYFVPCPQEGQLPDVSHTKRKQDNSLQNRRNDKSKASHADKRMSLRGNGAKEARDQSLKTRVKSVNSRPVEDERRMEKMQRKKPTRGLNRKLDRAVSPKSRTQPMDKKTKEDIRSPVHDGHKGLSRAEQKALKTRQKEEKRQAQKMNKEQMRNNLRRRLNERDRPSENINQKTNAVP